jgi:hypothetical protein
MIGRRIAALAIALPTALLTGIATASADIGLPTLTQVTIDCNDGAPIYTSLGAAQLTKLDGVISAMVEAGQPCALSQGPHDPSLDAKAMMVGAGVYGTADGCPNRFTVNAHLDAHGVHGSQTFKFIGSDPLCTTGFLQASVTCLSVTGNVGEARGIVQEAGGGNITDFAPVGTVFGTDGTDSPSGVQDMVTQQIFDPGTEQGCAAQGGFFPLDRGNIQVGGGS